MHDLLIGLLNEEISIKEAKKEQNAMIRKINKLRAFASSEYFAEEKSKGGIKKARTKTQKVKTYEASNSIIKNALVLYDLFLFIFIYFIYSLFILDKYNKFTICHKK